MSTRPDPDAPRQLDHQLSSEITRLRTALAISEHQYHDLLGAARAAVAAAARGDLDPLFWLVDELCAHGQLPVAGAVPERVAADTAVWSVLPAPVSPAAVQVRAS